MTIRLLMTAVMVAIVGGQAHAQEPAGGLGRLRSALKTGDPLTVTDTRGELVRGKLVQLDDTGIVLNPGNNERRRFEAQMVNTIEKRDPLRNGALIGLAIGAPLGVLGGVFAANLEGGEYVLWGVLDGAIYGGIGAAIGTGIDALIGGHKVVYERAKTTVKLAPLLSKDRKGIMLTLRR